MDSEESRVVLCMYEALFILFISIRFEDISYLLYFGGGLGWVFEIPPGAVDWLVGFLQNLV